ncbi:MAG: hypothetical protein E7458_08755 [Ruminococcaceae bacterium]|nr:hypothetical protein [Oscillospiraceae bacterium]
MKKVVDYSSLRGFNYTQPDSWNDYVFWSNYHHDVIERDMGYAERLHLNSARIFLPFRCYKENPQQFLANVKDFIRTAWAHGVSTNPIVYFGCSFIENEVRSFEPDETGLRPLSQTILDPTCWVVGEKYFDDLYAAIGQEEGLLFWDISNEPGYTNNFVTWYDEEPSYNQDFREKPNLEVLRERQEKTWEFIRHFCKYVKSVDPDHDIGIGNIFIWETEASRTAELVDVIVFHDYSATRARLRGVLEDAIALGKKYGKPVVDNEMACLARANPYDMAIELHDEYKVGWYLFELMIGSDCWSKAHGVCYPDGTIRDPAIVSSILGFHRNRTATALRADVNQENYVNRATLLAKRTLIKVRQSNFHDRSGDCEEVLEVCEFIANMLEAGELVPMAYPPTAKIEAYRRNPEKNLDELTDYLMELMEILKHACHIVREETSVENLRI